jgi:hypothetical protein
MDPARKNERYGRLLDQLIGLMKKTADPDARMATIVAVLHHKMEYFFWTGFYLLKNGELTVKTYQGPLACQVLEKGAGVCWAGINRKETIIVPTYTSSPAISPAIQGRIPRSSFRSGGRTATSWVSWMLTASPSGHSTKLMPNNSAGSSA